MAREEDTLMSGIVWNIYGPTWTDIYNVLANGTVSNATDSHVTFAFNGNAVVFQGSFTINGNGDVTGGATPGFQVEHSGPPMVDAPRYALDIGAPKAALTPIY